MNFKELLGFLLEKIKLMDIQFSINVSKVLSNNRLNLNLNLFNLANSHSIEKELRFFFDSKIDSENFENKADNYIAANSLIQTKLKEFGVRIDRFYLYS